MPHELYQLEDGTILPSVTEIISLLGSPALMRWSNSLGFRRIDYTKYMDDAALRGTICHEMISHFIDPSYPIQSYDLPESLFIQIKNYEKEILSFSNSCKFKPTFIEKPFLSKSMGYAGCPDYYGTIKFPKSPKGYEGVLKFQDALIDWKTSKKPQEKQFLQLGGYSKLLKEKGIIPKYYIIINLHENSYPTITVKNRHEIIPYEDGFTRLFSFWKCYSTIDPSVRKTKR